MPLSEPAAREEIHSRQIVCRGFRRADGLWEVEGHLTDVKTYSFANEERGAIEPGDPIHEMWLRLTVDDGLTVHAVEAVTDNSPFRLCGAIAPNFQGLVGLRIGPGWTRAVKERLGGVHGCTHLVELLGPVATTAFQTIFPIKARERAEREKAGQEPPSRSRPPLLDTCHAFASDGALVRQLWPDFHTGPAARRSPEAAD